MYFNLGLQFRAKNKTIKVLYTCDSKVSFIMIKGKCNILLTIIIYKVNFPIIEI